jgi:hypothetical protein
LRGDRLRRRRLLVLIQRIAVALRADDFPS